MLVAHGRNDRPWSGRTEPLKSRMSVAYDPGCYLCPNNTRASGEVNPQYRSTFTFTNDFASLQPDVEFSDSQVGLLRSQTHSGTCRVVCYSPDHSQRLATMTLEELQDVIGTWKREAFDLGGTYKWVQIFENKGEVMGASNPHPHGQIWAGAFLPTIPTREDQHQRRYLADNGSPLLVDYLRQEQDGPRLVDENDDWAVLVPYWAEWPFETIILPKQQTARITDVDKPRSRSLAEVLRTLLIRYDNLFEHPFPYSMGWHGAPFDAEDHAHWQLHAHFYPPLLRSVSVRKFMVGYELLAESQRDFAAEDAAQRLRSLPDSHYCN